MKPVVAALVGTMLAASLPSPALTAPVGPTARTCDIDGDGAGDAVVGVPHETVGPIADGGLALVLYGEGRALGGRTQLLSQAGPNLDRVEAGDRFGAAVACGDFDGDGYDDAAVGVPGEDSRRLADIGAVQVFPGGPRGVVTGTDVLLTQNSPAAEAEEADPGDEFGAALVAADFDGDGFDDLAIGVPGEDVGTAVDAGLVHVFFGSAQGLGPSRPRAAPAGRPVPRAPATGDRFGEVLAAGHLNSDRYADIVIGAPRKDVGAARDAGEIQVVFGAADGFEPSSLMLLNQDSPNVPEAAEAGDRFGAALAIVDATAAAEGWVAVGIPGEDVGAGAAPVVDSGAVWIRRFTPTAGSGEFVTRAVLTGEAPATGDHFGAAVVAATRGDHDHAVLAVGAPGARRGAGVVSFLARPGPGGGFAAGPDTTVGQDAPGVPGRARPGDGFGTGLAFVAGTRIGRDDRVLVAVPFDDLRAGRDAGLLHEFRVGVVAGAGGAVLVAKEVSTWSQSTLRSRETAEPGDRFGVVS